MKKLFLLLLLTTINTHPMDDMGLDKDHQNTPSPIWEQVRWHVVPENEITLEDRIKSINRIIRTLSGVVDRLEMLPCDSSKKAAAAEEINLFKSSAVLTRDYVDHVMSTPRNAQERSSNQEALKQFADEFLDPYHKTEKHLRASIENLERMAREEFGNDVNDLVENLA